jgi:hypothetical protein
MAEYGRAAAIIDRLVAARPNDREQLVRSWSIERGITAVLIRTGDRALALERARKLVGRIEHEVRRASEKDLLGSRLAEARLSLAAVHAGFGEWKPARTAAEQAAAQIRPLLTGRPWDPNLPLLRQAEATLAECAARTATR